MREVIAERQPWVRQGRSHRAEPPREILDGDVTVRDPSGRVLAVQAMLDEGLIPERYHERLASVAWGGLEADPDNPQPSNQNARLSGIKYARSSVRLHGTVAAEKALRLLGRVAVL